MDSTAHIKLTLRFTGDGLDTDGVSDALDLVPSETYRKGEQPAGQRAPYPTSYWGLESEVPADKPLTAHIDALVRILAPKVNALRELAAHGAIPTAVCGIFVADEEYLLALDPERMARLAALGLHLEARVFHLET